MRQLAFDFHREKKCSKCDQVKALDQFSRKRHSRDGRRSACKECHKSPVIKEREGLLAQGLQRCSKCRQIKALNEFYDRPTKYGRRTDCIECFQTRSKKHYLRYGIKVRAKARRYYTEHPEQMKDYRLKNREKRMIQKRRWDIENRDHILAYRQQNREVASIRMRKWRHENPERAHAIKSRYRTRKTGAGGSFTTEEWQTLCKQYDNRCLCCSEKKPLTHDHIIPVSKGGSSNLENLQPLCGSCNSKKGTKIIDYRPS